MSLSDGLVDIYMDLFLFASFAGLCFLSIWVCINVDPVVTKSSKKALPSVKRDIHVVHSLIERSNGIGFKLVKKWDR